MRETPKQTKRKYPLLKSLFKKSPSYAKDRFDPFRVAGAPIKFDRSKKNKKTNNSKITSINAEELIDFFVYGKDDRTNEVHIAFKKNVFYGAYLKLIFEKSGIIASFIVDNEEAQRAINSYGSDILAHLQKKGFKTNKFEIINNSN